MAVFNPDDPLGKSVVDTTRELQLGASTRLGGLRSSRSSMLKTKVRPGLARIAETEARGERQISRGIQGSMADKARSDLALGSDLAEQDLSVQELGNLLNQENGVQQLETMFTGMFNQLGAQAFAQELSGLGEEVNKYLAEEGQALNIASIQQQAASAATDMAGRFLVAAGSAFGGDTPKTPKIAPNRAFAFTPRTF